MTQRVRVKVVVEGLLAHRRGKWMSREDVTATFIDELDSSVPTLLDVEESEYEADYTTVVEYGEEGAPAPDDQPLTEGQQVLKAVHRRDALRRLLFRKERERLRYQAWRQALRDAGIDTASLEPTYDDVMAAVEPQMPPWPPQ